MVFHLDEITDIENEAHTRSFVDAEKEDNTKTSIPVGVPGTGDQIFALTRTLANIRFHVRHSP